MTKEDIYRSSYQRAHEKYSEPETGKPYQRTHDQYSEPETGKSYKRTHD